MHSAGLRRVGGSAMLAATSRTRPSYSLEELLAQCDGTAPPDEEDRAWLDSGPVGNELL